MTKRFLFCAVLISLTALHAFALTITQTKSFSGIPDMSGSLAFNQFDNNGGTLELQFIEVSLTLQTFGAQAHLDNDSLQEANGVFQFGANGSISSTDVILLDASYQPIPPQVGVYQSMTFSLDPDNGDGLNNLDINAPDGWTYNSGSISDNESGFVTNTFWTSGNKGFFGTGTYNIDCSITQWLNYGGIGGIEYAVTPFSADGAITVTYTYTNNIPEPAALSLFCISALVLRLRKK